MASGSLPPIPGILTGWVDVAQTVAYFSSPNTLTDVTFRLGIAAVGGTVTVELNTQADGLGDQISVVIADGATIGTGSGTVSIDANSYLYMIVTAESGSSTRAQNLSGDYTVSLASGVTTLLTSLARVKSYLTITATDATRDLLLNYLMAGVSQRMKKSMDRSIIQTTHTDEKIDSIGDIYIQTRHYPIIAITALTENTTALVEDTDFEMEEQDLENGQIARISGDSTKPWISGARVVKVTYSSGWASVPDDLAQLATELTVVKYHESDEEGGGWLGLASKGVDPSASVSFDKDLWAREAEPVLAPYRRMAFP